MGGRHTGMLAAGGALVVVPRGKFGFEVPTYQSVFFRVVLPESLDPAEEPSVRSSRLKAQVDGGNNSVGHDKLAAYRNYLFMTGGEALVVDAALWDDGSHKGGGLSLDSDIVFAATTSAARLVRDGRVKAVIPALNTSSGALRLLQQRYQRTVDAVEKRVELRDAGEKAAAIPF